MANRNPQNQDKLRRGGPGRPKGSKNRITRERWEQEVRHVAFSDVAQLFDRVAKGKRTFTLRDIQQMPSEIRRCIASIKVRTENLSAGDDQQDTTVEVRLWDKTKALELGARFHGWLKDKMEITAPEELISRLDRAKLRARGAKDGE